MEIDWKIVEAQNGLVPRETIKKFLIEATGAEVVFLEPGQVCMHNGMYIQEMPYSSGNKISRDEALIDALHNLLEERNGRNVIALRQATVFHQIGIRFYASTVIAAMYTKKGQK